MRCLLVEDDLDIRADIATALEAAGFIVDCFADGERAWMAGDTEDYDAVVLDLGLPVLDGLSVLKRWRGARRAFPVLVVSARGDWTEKVEGIEAGADDYIAKPFQLGELIARVKALVRRSAGRTSDIVDIGRLRLDTMRMSAVFDGVPVQLSPLEFRLLNYLAHQQDRTVSAGELCEHLYGASDGADANAVEAIVSRLRRKFGAGLILTRRGFGYSLDSSGQ
ncbi:MAG: response regulator transcription factor [Hyphomonadaceae bacterium]